MTVLNNELQCALLRVTVLLLHTSALPSGDFAIVDAGDLRVQHPASYQYNVVPVVPEFAVVAAGILRTPHPAANRYALVPITSYRIYAKKEKLIFDRKWSDVFFDCHDRWLEIL